METIVYILIGIILVSAIPVLPWLFHRSMQRDFEKQMQDFRNSLKTNTTIMNVVEIKVTNQELYGKTVIDVDVSGIRSATNFKCGRSGNFAAYGTLRVEGHQTGWVNWQGEFGARDLEEDYGFILTTPES